MYHSSPHRISAHDDVKAVKSAVLDRNHPDGPMLTVTYALRDDREYADHNAWLHRTNGINHSYDPVTEKVAEEPAKKAAKKGE